MANTPRLAPDGQFPIEAISESIQVQPPANMGDTAQFVFNLASSADLITQWGNNTVRRDRQLREFWPTESFLAGAVSTVCFRNASFDWMIKGSSEKVNIAVTEMLSRAMGRDAVGWSSFVKNFSQDLYTQDNGAFIELIRDPGMDANSRFKGANAPVIGIGHLDAGKCTRTGNVEVPVLYEDRDGRLHKLQWFEVIPFSEFSSSIEKMNGVGYSAVTRALRLAQIIRSISIFKDEEVSGRNVKKVHVVGGVGRTQIEDAVKRTSETADNKGQLRYIEHAVLASLDPEKNVSLVTIDLASLPEGFDYGVEMQWYISGLALDFGVDYQEFAPLPGGGIGSASQSAILDKKTAGKGPRNWMDSLSEAFRIYGVMPRGTTMEFNDKNEQDEMEHQIVRTKASEEAAIIVNSKILPAKTVAQSLVDRGIYSQKDFDSVPPEWWTMQAEAAKNEIKGQPVGDRGGNTIAEDAKRQDTDKPSQTVGNRLTKEVVETSLLDDVRFLIQKAFSRKQDVNVVVNNPAQPVPQVNLNVEAQPAPRVFVNNQKQEPPVINIKQDAPTVVVKEVPAPIVNVTNQVHPANVKLPRVSKQRQIVNRDGGGNIESTDTVFEYKE